MFQLVKVRLFKIRKCQKAESNEYTFDAQLGYIFATKTANDEVLAVAYQYTIGDKYTKWESLGMTVLMQRL
jgi:cell surface protein SprA